MSNDLESAVRNVLRTSVDTALHTSVADVTSRPDAADVSRRVTRRRGHHRLVLAGSSLAAAACVVVGLVVIAGRDDPQTQEPAAALTVVPTVPPSITEASSPPTTAVDPAACTPPTVVPFRPAELPAGMTLGPLSPVAHAAAWSVPNGMIEVWNGIRDDLPVPDHADRLITVLGQQAPIGSISDGYSVVVDLGPTRCERWAVIGHPSVSEEQLQAFAEGLTLITSG